MIIHRKDIERINDILEKFPDVTTFELKQEGTSGIGTCIYMTFNKEINGSTGTFEIEISGVDNW